MALSAVLEFGNNDIQRYTKRYLLADCRFLFARPYNEYSPDGSSRCERVDMTVVAPGREDLTLIQWFSNRDVQSGRIVIGLPGDSSTDSPDAQTLYFESAMCYKLSEHYDIDSSRRRLLKLSIVAETIEMDGVNFKRV